MTGSDDRVTAVQSWVYDRVMDVYAREFDRSLHVSLTKPLGSQGFGTGWQGIWRLGRKAWRLRKDKKGIQAKGFDEPTGFWLYRWHEEGLATTLNKHLAAQRNAGWHTEPSLEAMVIRTRKEPVEPLTPLFVMIADCYGDKTNPGRPEILPGVPRKELLTAYQRATGEPDPVQVYFELFGLI